MLSIGLYVNGELIDRIDIVNQGNKNSKGETLYIVDKEYKIRHKRKDGARALALKALSTIPSKLGVIIDELSKM